MFKAPIIFLSKYYKILRILALKYRISVLFGKKIRKWRKTTKKHRNWEGAVKLYIFEFYIEIIIRNEKTKSNI